MDVPKGAWLSVVVDSLHSGQAGDLVHRTVCALGTPVNSGAAKRRCAGLGELAGSVREARPLSV